MTMTARQMGLIAAAGSAALLLAAFGFQALGYAPCAMCLWQRYPHAVAVAVGGLLALGLPPVVLLAIGAAAATTTAGLGVYHTGVERDWWEGPTSCTGAGLDLSAVSAGDLLPSATTGPSTLVMCDEVVWQFLGLSMASWNAVASAVLVGLWVWALARALGRSAAVTPGGAKDATKSMERHS